LSLSPSLVRVEASREGQVATAHALAAVRQADPDERENDTDDAREGTLVRLERREATWYNG
jgi:hypothetical protein